MKKESMTFLGTYTGVSKKTNKFYCMAYFYGVGDVVGLNGYKPYTFFIDDDIKSTLAGIKPLQKVNCNHVFAGGQDVLISIEV